MSIHTLLKTSFRECSFEVSDERSHFLTCGDFITLAPSRLSSQCFLACHKRCLETLAIQCGHKKLQGRLQLFGREFTQVASCASDSIPFIITKCISEIERRALKMKVGSTCFILCIKLSEICLIQSEVFCCGGLKPCFLLTGNLPGEWGEDSCGETVSGL